MENIQSNFIHFIEEKKVNFLRNLDAEHFIFAIFGTIIWSLGYALAVFYLDFLLVYIRKDEKFGKSYFYKYIEYLKIFKLVVYFSLFYLILLSTLLFLIKQRYFCFVSGFFIFLFFYFLFLVKCYIFGDRPFELELYSQTSYIRNYFSKKNEREN